MPTTKLDLVLINPGCRDRVYQSLGASLTAVENPVWAGLMASFVQGKGLSVSIIDAEADELRSDDVAERVADLEPTLAVVVVYGHQPSASTQIMTGASAVCTSLKKRLPDLKILLVGGHAAALPQRTLADEQADFVAAGEGLHTMVDLVHALRCAPVDVSKVRGLWYRDNGPRCTPDADLLGDLDNEMPGVAWELLPMPKYRAHNWHCFGDLRRQPYAAIYTTLGCPYRCSFCCIQAPFKSGEKMAGFKESTNSYRYWSPDRVIGEIDILVNRYGVRNIKIADEMFVLNRKHVLGICDRIIERGYDLNIWAYARVDTVKDDMVDKLKRAGFNWLAFGIEAANRRVRADVDKRFDQEGIYRTIEKVQGAGINVIGNYIFGLPEDDAQSMEETYQMAVALNCEFANFYCAMAYPGSPLYDLAHRQGWALPAKWSGYSQHSADSLPLPTKYLSAGEVLRFRDEAFQKYFCNPAYLQMIDRRFGPAVVQHISEMVSHKLVRQTLPAPLLAAG
jgi:anaerobic magnesium-protoporphyrin IX monomethyl ester cyclase